MTRLQICLVIALTCLLLIAPMDACKRKCKDCGKFYGCPSECPTIMQHPMGVRQMPYQCEREIYDPYWNCNSCRRMSPNLQRIPQGYRNKRCGCNKNYYPGAHGYGHHY